jgi:Cu-Zn family superoxide dismutase
VRASADIFSCTDGVFLGTAALREEKSDEGVKEVSVSIHVEGLTPGKHAVHIHQTAECMPCGAAGGHFDPGPFGFTSPDVRIPVNLDSDSGVKADTDSGQPGHLSERSDAGV